MSGETLAIRRGRGKWGQRGVPHKGWSFVEEEDLGEPSETCQMCETLDIRYVHIMQHPDYLGGVLRCGCICAGHMAEDLKGARDREAGMKSRANRRMRFPVLKSWNRTAKGNERLDYRGRRIVIFRRGASYKVMIVRPDGTTNVWDAAFKTAAEAKLDVFDVAERTKQRRLTS